MTIGARQLKLDFPRATKLHYLEKIRLPDEARIGEGEAEKHRWISVNRPLVVLMLTRLDGHIRDKTWALLRQSTLAAECQCGVRTIGRAQTAAESLGLIETKKTPGACLWRIIWTTVARFAGEPVDAIAEAVEIEGASDQAPGRSFGSDSDVECSATGDQCSATNALCSATDDECLATGGGENRTRTVREAPLTVARNGATESQRKEDRPDEMPDAQTEEWRRLANRISRVVPIRGPGDRRLVANAAAAVIAGRLAEDDLWQSLESIELTSPKNPAAWFMQCLRNRIEQRQGSLPRVLCDCEFG